MLSITFKISYSFILSKDDVTSSKIKIFGFFMYARASAIFCFYIVESMLSLELTIVSNLAGNYSTKDKASAYLRASIISASVADGFP